MNKPVDSKIYDGKKKIAIILIRGLVRSKQEIRDTLKMLNLLKKNSCSIVSNTKSNMGMVEKVKDYITYGEISEDTLKLLVEKRSEKKGESIKPFFRLSPPVGGFERKGIKVAFRIGGALGYRGELINDLIKKMI